MPLLDLDSPSTSTRSRPHGLGIGRAPRPMNPLATTRTTMSMPMVMIATTKAGRPTIGRMAVRSMTRAIAAVASAARDIDRKNEPAKSPMPIAGAT